MQENVRANLVHEPREILKMRAKFATSTKFGANMVKRVSKSSVKGTFAQIHYREEINSVKVQLKDMVKRESLAEVRKNNSRAGDHLPNLTKVRKWFGDGNNFQNIAK